MVGLALLPVTSAASPSAVGDIVFATNRDGNYEIYTMTSSGGSQTNRTSNSADDTNPAFSADANKIAFVRGGSIYTMNADGTGISAPITAGDEPFWSPDGTKLAYTSGGDILVIVLASSSTTNLTSSGATDSSPAWSPDGTKIAYASGGDILVVPAAGGTAQNLTNSGATESAPSWSNDSAKIAYASGGDIWSMPATGGPPLTQLTANSFAESSPLWSPDGAQIAFTRDTSGNLDIWSMPAAGGPPLTQLTTHSAIDQLRPQSSGSAPVPVPTKQTDPVITPTGAITVTTVLTATDGTWTGSPTSFARQWKRCDTGGANCSFITGATGSTYTVATADVGSTLRIDVTATNSGGSSTSPATSAPTAVVTGATGVPVNTTAPTISGPARVGSPLTATPGVWTPVATSYTYQWKRCDAAGLNCVSIVGATLASYTPVAADLSVKLLVTVTATNASGPGTPKDSLPTEVVTAATALANTTRPVISGNLEAGQTATTTDGTWTSTPTTITYQWRRCNATTAACVNITGATSKTYVLVAADTGSKLAVVVTATNSTGTATATSDLTAVVGSGNVGPAVRPVNKTAPVVSGQAANGQTLRASNGQWNGTTPMTFAYQWQACDKNVTTCTSIQSATAVTYTIAAKDVGRRMRVRVTATNTAGSAAVASQATALIGKGGGNAGRKLVGTAKNDKLNGTAKNDTLSGRGGNDTLSGLAGNDLLLGETGNDKLYGGAGVDGLNGGAGRDLLSGGTGNDGINAAGDRARDVVDCGPGKDRATVGPTDLVRNCETVTRKKR
jgi:Tol biopolymer transport system component